MNITTIVLVIIPAAGLLFLLGRIDRRDRKKIGFGKDISLHHQRRREQRNRHSKD